MPIVAYGKIKPLRQAKGLNQADIAAELAVSRPTYVLIEQGSKEPTLTQLYTLSRLLGVDPGELCFNLPSLASGETDYDKFKQVVSVCIARSTNGAAVTKAKLSVLTYLCDFAWFNQNSKPMTGETYRCTARGPIADDFFRALDELYEGQAITIQPGGATMLFSPLESPATSLLNAKELALINEICTKWLPSSTESAITFALRQSPCKSVKTGDPIPYEAILNEPKESLY
jgi:transcriptional regulator with XRE-family HTH domain